MIIIKMLTIVDEIKAKFSSNNYKINKILRNAKKRPPINTEFHKILLSVRRKGCVTFCNIL